MAGGADVSAHTTEAFRKELEDRYNANLTKLREAVEATGYFTREDVADLREAADLYRRLYGDPFQPYRSRYADLADRLEAMIPPNIATCPDCGWKGSAGTRTDVGLCGECGRIIKLPARETQS